MKDFTPEEDLALIGLMREIIQADDEYSDEERVEVDRLRDDIGAARFAVAIEVAKKQFKSRKDLAAHVVSIKRVAAQKTILLRLREVAEADGIHPAEQKPLEWLAKVWPNAH